MPYYGENNNLAMACIEIHEDKVPTFKTHRHHHLEMIFVEQGEYLFTTPAGTQKYGPGDVFVANSDEDHSCETVFGPGDHGRYFYLQLSLRLAPRGVCEKFDRFLEELEQKKILLWNRIPRETAKKTGLFQVGQALAETSMNPAGCDEFKLTVDTLRIFQILEEHRLYTVPELQSQLLDPFVKKVSAYIDAHSAEDLKLDELAHVCGYDKHYFCNLFRKHFGMSFTHHLCQVRIKKFQSHPKLNQQTIAFCAADVGFSNYSYFYTAFRKRMGCSPREYLLTRGQNYGQHMKQKEPQEPPC